VVPPAGCCEQRAQRKSASSDVEIRWRKSRAPWARQRSREELDATRSRAEVCARIQRRNLKRSILAHLLLDGLTAVGRTLPGRPGLDGRTDGAGGAGRTEGRQKSRPVHSPGRASRRLAGRAAGRGPFRLIFPRSAYVLTVVGGPKTGRVRGGVTPPSLTDRPARKPQAGKTTYRGGPPFRSSGFLKSVCPPARNARAKF